MKLKIGDKTYPQVGINDVSLLILIELERQTGRTIGDLKKLALKSAAMSPEEAAEFAESSEGLMSSAMAIWLARRSSGERIDFLDAIDFPLSQLEYIEEPGDRKVADPQKPRAVNVRGDANPPKPAKKKALKAVSDVAS